MAALARGVERRAAFSVSLRDLGAGLTFSEECGACCKWHLKWYVIAIQFSWRAALLACKHGRSQPVRCGVQPTVMRYALWLPGTASSDLRRL